jgi:hypothetical protein
MTMSSPSLGECYTSTTVLAGLAWPGNVVPSVATTIASQGVTVCPRSSAPQPDADTESLDEDLRRISLAMGKMPVGHPVILPSGAAPPPAGSGSVSLATGTMPPWTFPYGLNTIA